MTIILVSSGLVIVVFAIFVITGPRPKLDALMPGSQLPADISLAELEGWLEQSENKVAGLIPGAEAGIEWADPAKPGKTRFCFLYLHGFSATRQETAPVTDLLAEEFGANAFHARLEGHGVGSAGMLTPSERWLQSALDSWHIASMLGEKVVIVATSTGAPLSVWLAHQESIADRIHAFLFLSPNFKIRNPFSFILTWPHAPFWVRLLIGKEISWEPQNEEEGKYWTSCYSTLSLIEMQKVVDWVSTVDFTQQRIPLATMYMKNDTTIDPKAAIDSHNQWGSQQKQLIPVTLDGDAEEHVFVGRITAPHRIEWCVAEFTKFLKTLDDEAHSGSR